MQSLLFAPKVGHVAAVIRLPLVNACLSMTAARTLFQVICYFCLQIYVMQSKRCLGCMWHLPSICLKPYVTRLADTCASATVKPAAHLIQYMCGLACVSASYKATAAALHVLASPVLHAPNIGHAAAVIWLLLINACLSTIADDNFDEVVQYLGPS
jgi:hypothetical protein